MAAQIRIGTSGWHYKHWCGPFYPKKCPSSQWFELYARVFDTVEVNNTFYRLPTEDALRNWHDAAPRKFCFSVKASRFITHIKRLRDPDNAKGTMATLCWGIGRIGSRAGQPTFRTFTA